MQSIDSRVLLTLAVKRPSTPTGPLAWIRPVEIPTSAPSPNRYPSANRVEALWNTHALSTVFKNRSAVALFSVMIHSVCPLIRQNRRGQITIGLEGKEVSQLMLSDHCNCHRRGYSCGHLPYWWMWSTASWIPPTTSKLMRRSPYSVLMLSTGSPAKPRDIARSPLRNHMCTDERVSLKHFNGAQ